MVGAAKVRLPALILVLLLACASRAEATRLAQAETDLPAFDAPVEESEEPGLDLEFSPKDEIGPLRGVEPQDQAAPPPHSAGETKQDRLGGSQADAPTPVPVDRATLLAQLYEKLPSAKDPGAARDIMRTIEQVWRTSESDTANLLMSRAERLMKDNDPELAAKILDATIDVSPDVVEAYYMRARMKFEHRNWAGAIPDLKQAVERDPKHYKALNDLGIAQFELGQKKEALDSFRKAVAVNPFLDQAKREVELLERELEGREL
jgi:tetratricopeptide (TPR) repeat protein